MATFSELGFQEQPGKQRYMALCPECSHKREKHPKLRCVTINDEPGNQWWNCFNCGYKGNLGDHERYAKIQEKTKMPANMAQIKSFSQDFAKYISSRGLSTATLLKESIYESKGSGGKLIGFPFYISRTCVNVKFLNRAAKESQPKWFRLKAEDGAKTCFLGFPTLKLHTEPNRTKRNYLIITEGEWDWLTWKECGHVNVLSVPMGAPSETAKDFTKEFAYVDDTYFQKAIMPFIDTFYLSVDEDGPGNVLKNELGRRFDKVKCKLIKYPKGYKDINEVLAGSIKKKLSPLGREGVQAAFDEAGSFPIKGIFRPSDLRFELNQYREGGMLPGLKTGIGELDYLMTFKRQHLSFHTGIPNMGKSTFVRFILVKLIQNNPELNLKFALFTPENRPMEREFAMIAQVLTGKQIKLNQWNSMNDELFRKTMNFIEKHFFIVAPGPRNYETFNNKIKVEQVGTLDSLLQYFKYLSQTEGVYGFLIDAWNKIQHQIPRNIREDTYIEQQLDKILDFINIYDMHGAVVAHPTKQSLNKETGRYEIPSMYDIKGASAWNERADIGVVYHRNLWKKNEVDDKEDDRKYVARTNAPMLVKTEKMRFEEVGNRDMVRFVMNSTGGFRVYDQDAGMHLTRLKKKIDDDEEERMSEYASKQKEIPDFVDGPADPEEKLPF